MPSLSAPPTLDANAALRWYTQLQRGPQAPWLHAEVASRMVERLDLLRLASGPILHWEPTFAGPRAQAELLQRLGKAQVSTVAEKNADLMRFSTSFNDSIDLGAIKKEASGDAAKPSWLSRLGAALGQASGSAGRSVSPEALPPGQASLVWSNLLIHGHPQPQTLVEQWFDALAVGGCVMFSALGVDTGRELSSLHRANGWGPAAAQLTDMHDWGDMLLEAGFADPVMDMEHLRLTYRSADALLRELRGFGRNAHAARFGGLRSRQWLHTYRQALASQASADGDLTLTVEIIYGHAFKPAPRVKLAAESAISMREMRGMLRQPRVR